MMGNTDLVAQVPLRRSGKENTTLTYTGPGVPTGKRQRKNACKNRALYNQQTILGWATKSHIFPQAPPSAAYLAPNTGQLELLLLETIDGVVQRRVCAC